MAVNTQGSANDLRKRTTTVAHASARPQRSIVSYRLNKFDEDEDKMKRLYQWYKYKKNHEPHVIQNLTGKKS